MYMLVCDPVDFRYAWGHRAKHHRAMFTRARKALRLRIWFGAPSCTQWSQTAKSTVIWKKINQLQLEAYQEVAHSTLQWMPCDIIEQVDSGDEDALEKPGPYSTWCKRPLGDGDANPRVERRRGDARAYGRKWDDGAFKKQIIMWATLTLRRTSVQCRRICHHCRIASCDSDGIARIARAVV